jgi:HK97 family phage portal protein
MGLLSEIATETIGQLRRGFGANVVAKAANSPEGPGWSMATSLSSAIRNFNSYSSRQSQLNAYVDWVYGAVRAIAEDAASVDLELYVNRGSTKNAVIASKMIYNKQFAKRYATKHVDISYYNTKGIMVKANVSQLEEIENHQLLDLLAKPNDAQTKTEFLEFTFTHLELTGEAFWLKERNAQGVVVKLWPLNPTYMEEKVKGTELEGWVYHNNGKRIPIETTEIVHHKYTDPNNMWRGMGVVKAAARAVDTDTQSADYNRRFFANNGRIDAALQTATELSDESFARMKQEWNDTYGGVANAHKIAILEGGLEYKPLNLSQKEMDFLESRKFNRDQILALFRVSASILGISENVNRSNAEAAEYGFGKRVLRPKLERLTTNITENLAVDFDSKLLVSFVDPVPEDKEFNLKRRESELNKYRTVNEIRAELGDEPITGGDELYVPFNSVPLSYLSQTSTPADDATKAAGSKKKVLAHQ